MNVITGERAAPEDRRLDPTPAANRRSEGDGDLVGFDISSLIATIWREKLVIAAIAIMFGTLAMVGVYSVTPLYRADSVVMLDRTEEQVIDLESVVSGLTADYYSILAEAEVLRSRQLAGRVVDELNLTENAFFNPDLQKDSEPPLPIALLVAGIDLVKQTVRGAVAEREAPGRELLEPDYFVRQTAIDILLDMQSVASIENTYVYRVMVETDDPILSAEVANTFADLYITDQLEKKFEATQAATEWLGDRVAQLKEELEISEAEVEAFNSTTTLVSEEALAIGSRQLKDLRERREELTADARALDTRIAAIETAVAAGDAAEVAALVDDRRVIALLEDLRSLPDTAGGSRRQALEVRIENAKDLAIARLASEQERQLRQVAGLETSIAELETQFERQTTDLVQLRQLQREAEANRRIYEQFLRRLNETSVQQGVQQADARLLSPAVVDFRPSYPNKTLLVLAAILFGGLAGTVGVVVQEQMNRAFRSAEDLERSTGVAVLGTIPAAPVRRRRDLISYARDRASSQLVEAVRNLRTGVLLANVDRQPKVVMLTSSLPKEGKTTCSLLLAQNAAALGKKVLLVECDLRRRTFRTYFDISGEDGLVSILTGAREFDDVVHRDPDSGLHVIPGEATKVNAADVFASKRFADFVETAREKFDFVVIDTPPVLAVPDARVIAPLVDAVLYCVRWNSTHKDLVRNGIALFTQIKVRISGLALTQVNLRKQAQYGYGGYNYYYYKSSKRYYVN